MPASSTYFFDWLLKAALAKGFQTQKSLADALGWTKQQLETTAKRSKRDGPTMRIITRLAEVLEVTPGDVANAWAGVEVKSTAAPVIALDPLYNSFIEARRKYGDVAVMVQLQQLEAAAAQLASPKPPALSQGNAGAVASPRRRRSA